MTEPTPSLFQRIISRAASLYLLFMLVYLLLRFIVQDRFWPLSMVNGFALLLFLPLPFLLVLALVARSRRGLVSLLPIILVMILWFGPRFLSKASAANPSVTIRILTNNLWHLNPTPEQFVQLANAAKPDVIFLQEVQLDTQQAALDALKADYPYQSSQVDEIRLEKQDYTAVNLTLSRYPLSKSGANDDLLANMPFIDRNVIEINGQSIALYNVHLLAPVGGRWLGPLQDTYFARITLGFDDSERNQQIDWLLAYLATEPYPYIAAGDFNTSDSSMTYVRLAAAMHDSYNEAGSGYGGSWPMTEALGWPSFIPPLIRMDYIWHSAGIQAVNNWQGEFDGSDHLPLFADLGVGS